MLPSSSRRSVLTRAFVVIALVTATIGGATIARAAVSTSYTITLNGDQNPSFPLGQVDISLHIADQSSTPAPANQQVSLMHNSVLIATEQTDANGNVEFPSDDFGNDTGYAGQDFLGVGAQTLVANFGDTSQQIDIAVTEGQATPHITVNDNGDGSATFGYTLGEGGSLPNDVFPQGLIKLIEDGDTTNSLSHLVVPVFQNGAPVSALFGTFPLDAGNHSYQAYYAGDGRFAAASSSPWSTSAYLNTQIAWSTLPDGETKWPSGSTTVTATINADDFNGSVDGTATLFDNNVAVATTSVTNGTDLVFHYTPTDGVHSFTIHYDGSNPFVQSDSDLENRIYAPTGSTTTTTSTTSTTIPTTTTTVPGDNGSGSGSGQPHAQGYRLVSADGTVTPFGGATSYGDMHGQHLNAPIIAAIDTHDDGGYWLIAKDGGIFSFGDAHFWGSMGGSPLNAPVVGMAPTPTGNGYWLVAADGGIFSYGDAHFYGSMGSSHLNAPVVGMTTTPTGDGYRFVASDGGIFSYGNAAFFGSMGGSSINKPVVGMAPTFDSNGYWLVASDGGIFSYGNAHFWGSTGDISLNKPIVGMLATPDSQGYWFVASDGGVFSYGNATYLGAEASSSLTSPVVAIA